MLTELDQKNARMTNQITKFRSSLCLAVLFLSFGTVLSSLNAQSVGLFEASEKLTEEQQVFIKNTLSKKYYKDVKFVSTKDLMSMLKKRTIEFSLLGSKEIYKAENVSFGEVKSPYYDEIWMGNLSNGEIGNVLLIRKDQLLAGFIQTEKAFFSIVPTANNLAFLVEHEADAYDTFECGFKDELSNLKTKVDPCKNPPGTCSVVIDVSVLLTDEAMEFLYEFPGASSNPFIPVLYTLVGLEATNFALINSAVDNAWFRFTIERFFFGYYSTPKNIEFDINGLATTEETLEVRNALGGDLVVLLTNQQYGNNQGIVDGIGPSEDNAYAIVEMASLISPRWTFAHEVGHLMGARHSRPGEFGGNDDTDVCSHGFAYDEGTLGLKRTLLAVFIGDVPEVPPGTGVLEFLPGGRLLNYSNPNVIVDGSPSGTEEDDNARTIENTGCEVFMFRPSPVLNISLLAPDEVCMQDILMGSVVIFEPNESFPGQPPYTINWNVSSSNTSTVFIPIQVSYPQQITVTVTVVAADGLTLSRSKTVNIVDCEG